MCHHTLLIKLNTRQLKENSHKLKERGKHNAFTLRNIFRLVSTYDNYSVFACNILNLMNMPKGSKDLLHVHLQLCMFACTQSCFAERSTATIQPRAM